MLSVVGCARPYSHTFFDIWPVKIEKMFLFSWYKLCCALYITLNASHCLSNSVWVVKPWQSRARQITATKINVGPINFIAKNALTIGKKFEDYKKRLIFIGPLILRKEKNWLSKAMKSDALFTVRQMKE
jgi:hypothetical protein